MLIVVFSSSDAEFDALYKQVVLEQLGQVASFNLGAMAASACSALLSSLKSVRTESSVSLLRNPTVEDLALLRRLGAVVCHRYELGARYRHERLIEHGDLFYATKFIKPLPPHVLAVDEMLTEAKIRHRKRVRAHAA